MTEQPAVETTPVINIEGGLVGLGPLRRDLLDLYGRWNNDFGVTRNLARSRPTTLEQEAATYDELIKDTTLCCFTVYERATWRPIGVTYLAHIDHWNRCADFGIVIGERDCHGKGYGTETTRLALDYAFTVLGLNNVELTCRAHNLAGLRVYEKAGLKEVGRRRQCRWLAGRPWDNVYMDCIAAEFDSPVLRHIFVPDEPRGARVPTE